MGMIDKQRIEAVRELEHLGYRFAGGEWMKPANDAAGPLILNSDALHALIIKRADELAGCIEESEEAVNELAVIAAAIEAYEAVRWPQGRAQGGKG
jgi:hypothetical protein